MGIYELVENRGGGLCKKLELTNTDDYKVIYSVLDYDCNSDSFLTTISLANRDLPADREENLRNDSKFEFLAIITNIFIIIFMLRWRRTHDKISKELD